MKGVNSVTIIGTLGADPEVRQTANGKAACNMSVAVNEYWTDKNTGKKEERTEWVRVVLYGKPAEVAGQYLKKGSQAYFNGKMQTRKWVDQQSITRYTTEVLAFDMQLLGGTQREDAVPSKPEETDGGAEFDSIPFADPYKNSWRSV